MLVVVGEELDMDSVFYGYGGTTGRTITTYGPSYVPPPENPPPAVVASFIAVSVVIGLPAVLPRPLFAVALRVSAILVGLCAAATILRLGLFLTPVLALQVWAVCVASDFARRDPGSFRLHLRWLLALIMEAINDDIDTAEAEADADSRAEVRLVAADADGADLPGRRGSRGWGGPVGDHPAASSCPRMERSRRCRRRGRAGRVSLARRRRRPRRCGPRSTGSRRRWSSRPSSWRVLRGKSRWG